MTSIHRRTRVLAVALTGLALVVLPAAAASAHVQIAPGETAAGADTVLTVRVPNESDTATTSKLVVDLPTDHPLLSVSTKSIPGWKATVATAPLPAPAVVDGTTVTEAVSTVTWTADPGSEIGDGQFQEFELAVGPLPDAGTELQFPAHQTYTDGTVVDWTDQTPASGEEPEHPVPAFTTTAAEPEGGSATAADDPSGQDDQSDTLARTLGLAGVVLGAAALVITVVSVRRRRVEA